MTWKGGLSQPDVCATWNDLQPLVVETCGCVSSTGPKKGKEGPASSLSHTQLCTIVNASGTWTVYMLYQACISWHNVRRGVQWAGAVKWEQGSCACSEQVEHPVWHTSRVRVGTSGQQ